MVSTSLFVLRSRPQKVLDHVLLSVLFLLSHIVTCTLTTDATTTAPTGEQGFLSLTKNVTTLPISVPPAAVMSTSSTAHQVITSGSETKNLTVNSEANNTTTTAMSPQVTATANTTTGTKKPTSTSEVTTTTTTTATSLVTAFANATNGGFYQLELF
ncbi:hypothetical protein PDJAM_G00081770 [Pangasius djambal]|uniref:Uncharacterized protein n=1 Tax=Pangasius djambal TaxID=1691987 RepID=A0ACC5Z2X2_9TELE|nr:hypothetical protein [Pangasius djambal]